MLPASSFLANRYVIIRKIGQGGMGAVYQVQDTRFPGVFRAVKEMSAASINDPVERQNAIIAFQQEARLLTSLNHPNIPRVIDTFEEMGKHFLVMEYVDGHTLEQELEQRGQPFDEATVLGWLGQLCSALGYLHGHNPPIIFRDLKTSNIMLDANGKIQLIDFGIARRFTPGKQTDTNKLGTEGYAAPEQYGKGQTDARSDIYALGVTMHRLLTGFDSATSPFNLPKPTSINRQITPKTEQLVMRALEQDPRKRWQTTSELEAAIGIPSTPGPRIIPSATGSAPTVQVSASRRPTTRLVQAAAQLTTQQLLLALGGLLLAIFLGVIFLGPVVQRELPFVWSNVPLFLLAGPIFYAGLRRMWVGLIAHVAVTVIAWAAIWATIGAPSTIYSQFLLGTLVSGLVIEGGFYYLFNSYLKNVPAVDSWKKEMVGYSLICLATALTFYLIWSPAFGRSFFLWIGALLIGPIAWFAGDLLHEWLSARYRMP